MFECGVIAGRENERKTVIPKPGRHLLRSQLGRDAQRGQHIGTAGFGGDRAVAVLGNRYPGRRRHDRHRSGDVKRPQLVPAGAANIEHLAAACFVIERHRQRLLAQLTCERGDLLRRFALGRQCGQKLGLSLRRERLIRQAVDRIAHLLGCQRLIVLQLLGQGVQHGRNDTRAAAAGSNRTHPLG